MKFATTVVLFIFSSLAGSSSLPFFGNTQVVIGTDVEVPGENPLVYCQDSQAGDILAIENVDLEPNPPVKYKLHTAVARFTDGKLTMTSRGETLSIIATGTFKEQIEEGAYILLRVNYGYIKLVNTKADLCEQIKNVNMTCPIDKG